MNFYIGDKRQKKDKLLSNYRKHIIVVAKELISYLCDLEWKLKYAYKSKMRHLNRLKAALVFLHRELRLYADLVAYKRIAAVT